MCDDNDKLNELSGRIETLEKVIQDLKSDINRLRLIHLDNVGVQVPENGVVPLHPTPDQLRPQTQ